jgi:predicted neuraminidase
MKNKFGKVVGIIALFLVGFLLYQKRQHDMIAKPRFIIESTSPVRSMSSRALLFESAIIPQPLYLPAAHSSSFTMLANDDLLAFWFAGTKEGQPDVKIWHSTYHNGKWDMATSLVDPQMIAKANHRYVIKVGNPVIYRAANGVLHLFVVSVSIGGWSGSALNHLQSQDNGLHWTSPERIVISPFFNISTLVRTSAVGLSDGGFYLPVYHEFIRKYPELLRFDADGNFIQQIRITNKNKMLQPSLVPVGSLNAWTFFRNSANNSESRVLYTSQTTDGGMHWSDPEPTNLTNPDASIAAVSLNDGRMLMVYNDISRAHLWLAISYNGTEWHPIYQLEDKPGEEFSYPSIQVNGNLIDILYTNNRQNIKHVRFNRNWLNEEINHAKH